VIRSLARIVKTAAVGFAIAAASTAAFAQSYPNRPITLIVPWGAGGGTDATARIIGSLLEKELGQPINVVNRTGGSGVVGHQAIASSAPDGYTLGLITVEITMMHHQKLTDLTHASYTPLALVNLDPAGFQVRADSPYKTMNDVIAAIKAAPAGKFKASGTGQGGIWHLALAGMLSDLKMDPAAVPWVPSNGAAPGLQDLVAGGVEFVPCSLPEARSLIDAGKVRSLAVMADKRATLYPNVPTLKEATGSNWGTGAWRGVAAPKGLPADIRTRLEAALKKVYDSKEYQEFMASRGFGVIWGNGEEFGRFMAKGDADMKAVMTAVGIVK
jgi:tripartite-type tricarboxylate transporter receptor subunit TctC